MAEGLGTPALTATGEGAWLQDPAWPRVSPPPELVGILPLSPSDGGQVGEEGAWHGTQQSWARSGVPSPGTEDPGGGRRPGCPVLRAEGRGRNCHGWTPPALSPALLRPGVPAARTAQALPCALWDPRRCLPETRVPQLGNHRDLGRPDPRGGRRGREAAGSLAPGGGAPGGGRAESPGAVRCRSQVGRQAGPAPRGPSGPGRSRALPAAESPPPSGARPSGAGLREE